jgi:hypothetical protein
MHEVENFQILGPLGCQGWVVIPQNVKKVKITAPYSTYIILYVYVYLLPEDELFYTKQEQLWLPATVIHGER